MASLINPSNIDEQFPIAGQDNDSQGFRDNFNNIKDNLVVAATELSDLQGKVIVKSALDNTTLDNDMIYNKITHAQLTAYSETYFDNGGLTAGARVIDYDKGNFQRIISGGSITLGLDGGTHWPAAGQVGKLTLWFQVTSTSHTLTFPSTCTLGFPDTIANSVVNVDGTITITFPAIGDYYYEFSTVDAGANILVKDYSKLTNNINGNLTVSGTITAASIISATGNSAVFTGNVTANNVIATTSLRAPDLFLTGNLTVPGTIYTSNIVNTGGTSVTFTNVFSGNSTVSNVLSAANVVVTGNITLSGNVLLSGNALPINELTNVTITSPKHNDILHYDSVTSNWVNTKGATSKVITIAQNGPGGTSVFNIDGVPLKSSTDTVSPIRVTEGNTYVFDISDPSNTSGEMRFSTSIDGTHSVGGVEYLTGVNRQGTAGSSGAYIELTVTSATPKLYVYANAVSGPLDNLLLGQGVAIDAVGSAVDTIQYETLSTTSNVAILSNVTTVIINSNVTISSANISMPSAPSNGATISVGFGNTITSLTMYGGTIHSPLTSANDGTFGKWVYSSSGSAWFRIG